MVVVLAAASVGAMFSSTSPDMGVRGILDRYRQVTPKLLFVDTEVLYGGMRLDLMPKIGEISKDLFSAYHLERTVLLPSTITGKYPNAHIPQRYVVLFFDKLILKAR